MGLRYLPCAFCRQPALATKDGVLHTAARLSDPVINVPCRRCGRVSKLTHAEFVRLPELTPEEVADRSCDLPGEAVSNLEHDAVAARRAGHPHKLPKVPKQPA